MQRIFLVRHGETDWNRQLRIQGKENIPLNKKGREQAQKISRYLSSKNFSAIFSSPLARAWETAQIIAAEHSLIPTAVDELAEVNFGNLEGKTYGEMNEQERVKMEKWLSDPASNVIPGGESLQEFRQRSEDCYKIILDNHTDGNLLIVTHTGTIRILVAAILKVPLDKITRLKLEPASLTIILYDDWKNPYLELFNGASHLD